ncbi:MAG: flavin-containing monooxygenase [Acidimicrobiales bacterium]
MVHADSNGQVDQVDQVDVAIVGAGFAGMFMLHRLREMGLSARGFERGSGVGGTWYWNRYPGARCDIESMEYSYQFDDDLQQEWSWSERFAPQAEILEYANHVADRYDLRDDIQFDTTVQSATFDEDADRWTVKLSGPNGEREVSSQFVVMATGCLSSANTPDFPGLDSFEGETYHTGRWPQEGVDFTGKRVAVIGTGSSGVQSIPIIAEQADQLTVFQRTAAFVVPAANAPLDPTEEQEVKAHYAEFRAANSQQVPAFGSRTPANEQLAAEATPEERQSEFERRWEQGGLTFLGAYGDLLIDPVANDMAAEFVRSKIREIVDDPAVADLLSPHTLIGAKRLCLGTDYYETYNRPNVSLVDVSSTPITAITPSGVQVGDQTYDVDVIVFATGFDAMTGSLLAVDIRGRDGLTLREAWHAGPRTYLGLEIPGFPNLFTVSGPGSPSVLTNMMVSIEHHVNWIADCIGYLRDNGKQTIEALPESADQWVEYVNAVAAFTVYPEANSWYLGANIPGKPRIFMPLIGFPPYVEQCAAIAEKGYEGFALA